MAGVWKDVPPNISSLDNRLLRIKKTSFPQHAVWDLFEPGLFAFPLYKCLRLQSTVDPGDKVLGHSLDREVLDARPDTSAQRRQFF